MTHFPVVLCLAALGAAVPAQSFLSLPATANPASELPNYTLLPLMQVNCRVQFFYTAAEVGMAQFQADQLEWRYDGPIPQVGYPGPFQIQRLRIDIGTTTNPMPGPRFADNLSQPLQPVFDGPWTFMPDPGSAFPHPWGGPNGSLAFPFQAPAAIDIPAGGWLVVDVRMEGNNIANFGYSHAILDGAPTSGGVVDGNLQLYGQGCPVAPGRPAASLSVSGTRAPGAAYFLSGQNLGAFAPVFTVFGLSNSHSGFGALPFPIPGSTCSILTSIDYYGVATADAAGFLSANQPGSAMAVPANPAFAGVQIYSQLATLAPSASAFGVAVSNAAAVTLGSFQPLGRGTYLVGNGDSALAPVATEVRAFGCAMRLRTL
ncbi:MAG: hypothetical protein JNK49_02105 [Planctomycetes bacterium]|nr:hypothetical protein [Planctomycetota bacterium]